jgi:MFS transporter, DHA1 family, multidrug resistance protein
MHRASLAPVSPSSIPPRHPAVLTAALVVVTGVGPLATDTYIAALPALRRSLDTGAAVAQLTLTAFIIGMAAGQVALGPLSDGWGRRRLLIGGAIAFTLTSALCALAPTGPLLVAVRLVQGLAAGSGVAIGRAVVGDVYTGDEAARRYGTLAAIVFLGPVVAPAAGGAILALGSWRTVFAALTGFGLLMVAAVRFAVPETLAPADRHRGGLPAVAARMGDLLGDWSFMRHVAVQCLASAGFFTYIGGSSFVLETVYGISETRYSVIFATNAAAMAVSSLTFRLLVGRVSASMLRTAGLLPAAAATVALVVVALLDRPVTVAVPWALLCCVTLGMGLVIPATTALAQEAGARARGTASALQGGLSFLVGALVTPLTGVVGYHSLMPMALLMAGFFAAAGLLNALTLRNPPRPRRPTGPTSSRLPEPTQATELPEPTRPTELTEPTRPTEPTEPTRPT